MLFVPIFYPKNLIQYIRFNYQTIKYSDQPLFGTRYLFFILIKKKISGISIFFFLKWWSDVSHKKYISDQKEIVLTIMHWVFGHMTTVKCTMLNYIFHRFVDFFVFKHQMLMCTSLGACCFSGLEIKMNRKLMRQKKTHLSQNI
jgi:hypothetical protein